VRNLVVSLMALAIVLLAYLAMPSSRFLNVVSVTAHADGWTTIVRKPRVPWTVRARWREEIIVVGGPTRGTKECPDTGIDTYGTHDLSSVRYPTSDKLGPCLAASPPIVGIVEHQVLLFGVLAMRPTITPMTIEEGARVLTPEERADLSQARAEAHEQD
jgi:hypothetical protein